MSCLYGRRGSSCHELFGFLKPATPTEEPPGFRSKVHQEDQARLAQAEVVGSHTLNFRSWYRVWVSRPCGSCRVNASGCPIPV